jgi:hypothetical protein
MFTLRYSLLLTSLIVLSGCSRGPNLVEVEGALKLRGKPLPGVMVCFVPDAEAGTPGPRSTGWTDEKGYYRLMCDKPYQPGAVEGKHRVIVLDPEAFDGPPGTVGVPGPEVAMTPPKGRKPKQMQFALKYLMPSETPLRVDVQAPGPQTIDLNVE